MRALAYSSRAEGSPLTFQDLWPLVLVAILILGLALLIVASRLAERRK